MYFWKWILHKLYYPYSSSRDLNRFGNDSNMVIASIELSHSFNSKDRVIDIGLIHGAPNGVTVSFFFLSKVRGFSYGRQL